MPALTAADVQAARDELARRSLVDYAQTVDVPGQPAVDDPDAWLFNPIETKIAQHHKIILDACQRTMETRHGRLMIFAPPGSAKSTYASVVAPTWFVGKEKGRKVIMTSYATPLARKQGRRSRQICRSKAYQRIFNTALTHDTAAADEWTLTNGSEYMAGGILAGITGNRANGIVIDDPVAGREEADSEPMRKKTREAYEDDLLSRLIPGGWVILIMTRWHMDDLAGGILPEGYNGESGEILCRDGKVWTVVCLAAKAESSTDPLGRKIGEYIWPEWFDAGHWAQFERNVRTWSALFQQRPAPESGGQFEKAWFHRYDPGERPARLSIYGATDYAVTESQTADFTEHGVAGLDDEGNLWLIDGWSGQEETDKTIEAFLRLVKRWKPLIWFGEAGVIEKTIGPSRNTEMRAKRTFVAVEALPTIGDKKARASVFRGMAKSGTVYIPRTEWGDRVLAQLALFPVGRWDDIVDMCGLFGRGLDHMANAPKPPESKRKPGLVPFTREWLEYDDKPKTGFKDYTR